MKTALGTGWEFALGAVRNPHSLNTFSLIASVYASIVKANQNRTETYFASAVSAN
jgi:hypothetical protein